MPVPQSTPAPPGDGGFPPGSFTHLSTAEDGSFWFRSRNRLIVDLITGGFPHASAFLEVGCGTGYVLSEVARATSLAVTGTDLHEEALDHARARSSARLLRKDARQLDFRADFDVVGAFDVLEHIPEDVEVMCRMRAAVRPGGGVIVTVPQHPWMWSAADEYGHHIRRYTRAELIGKLRLAGFEPTLVSSFVTTLLPVMAASRYAARRSGASYDPTAEFRIPGIVDRTFERILDGERALIRRGVCLPVGGSLVAVAMLA
jgi:SAM-dependent methyltransferase